MSVEIVAEIGSNWNGDMVQADLVVTAAAKCGADTVKFQHYPDERYGPYVMDAEHLGWMQDLANREEVDFLCSVFDQQTLTEYIEECQPSRVKIASPELTDHDLLRACADAGLHIILSTGMSTATQIGKAVGVTGPDVTLLHCVSSYPVPPEEMNLSALYRLGWWAEEVGLSDHSLDPIVAPVAATALGAVMIEKHFTLDRTQEGPDHSYALDPPAFKAMVEAVRLCESMLGDGVKRVMPSEDPTDRRTEQWRAA